MIKQERKICKEILKSEISLYDPAYVLFVTGWDWFREFWPGELGTESFLSKAVIANNTSNGINSESIFKYEGRKFVVSCRPERRNEQDFVKSVLDCYSKL